MYTWGIELEGALVTLQRGGLDREELQYILQRRWGWAVHRDGSVGNRHLDNSFEAVSPVLTGFPPSSTWVQQELQPMLQFFVGQGIRAPYNGGVHVHLGSLTSLQKLQCIMQWEQEEAEWFTLYPPHIAGRSEFVHPWHPDFHALVQAECQRSLSLATRLRHIGEAWYGIHQGGVDEPAPPSLWAQEYNRRRDNRWDVARYHAFNLSALDRHDTLEFRIFPATFKLPTVLSYFHAIEQFLTRAQQQRIAKEGS